MRDSDWSREKMLRSDWSGPRVATFTTTVHGCMAHRKKRRPTTISMREFLMHQLMAQVSLFCRSRT